MAEWKSGQLILGEYTIEKEIGQEGAMGRVWLVKSQSTGRRFAVKQALIRDEEHRKAFLAELQTWIDLPEHPNIVPCRFFRTVGDEIVIFADYIEGGSLADWIAKGKLTGLEQILDVAIQFAWGLHAIHERGLIHQDVKPGNVLMTLEGVPMVTDFGLARARLRAANGAFVSPALPPGQQSVLVSFGGMTPAYASPEQQSGRPLSRKTDIWSWGVSVLDMFMGCVSCPHGGHIARDVLESLVVNEQESDESPEIPVDVVDILRRCFARDTAARWPEMSAAATSLAAAFSSYAGHPYSRSAPSLTEQAGSWPYVRRDYTGGTWSDPQKWLAVAHAMQGGDILQMPAVLQDAHQSRSGSAVSDLAKYQEACGILARLADAENKNAARCVCDLCFEMAHIHNELNDLHGMFTAYDQCVHYAEVLRGETDVVGHADLMIARALDQKALGYRTSGDIAAAVQHYNQSIGHWRSLLASHQEHHWIEADYAITLRNAAIAFRNAGDEAAAVALYDEVIRVFDRLIEQHQKASDSHYRMELQRTWRFKGVALRKSGHVQEALRCYGRASAILAEMSSTRSDSEYYTDLARLHEVRACILPPAEAVAEFDAAINLYEMLIADYSTNNLMADLAGAYCSCCGPHAELGDYNQALVRCSQALRTWDEVINRMGKREYVDRYYEARLSRLCLYLQKNDQVAFAAESRALSDELRSVAAATSNIRLASLYQLGRANGYWR